MGYDEGTTGQSGVEGEDGEVGVVVVVVAAAAAVVVVVVVIVVVVVVVDACINYHVLKNGLLILKKKTYKRHIFLPSGGKHYLLT